MNKDIPDNTVAVGTPARVIGTFDDFSAKRHKAYMYPDELAPLGHKITEELEDWCWNDFHAKRN